MSTLYEYYNTGDDGQASIAESDWGAQTFTPATSHKITSVKLLLLRYALPGTVTVSIRATVDGHPSGEDLCSGTTDGDTLPTASPYEWREITLGAGFNLDADTKYAIVVRALNGQKYLKYISWRADATDPTYAGGCYEASANSGVDWTSYTEYDFMFEDWGEAIAEGTTVTPGTLSLTITQYAPILKEVTTPTTLSLSTTGYAPILAEVLTPTTLSIILTAYAPVLNTGIIVGLLELVLTGYAPTLGEEAPFRHAWGIIFG